MTEERKAKTRIELVLENAKLREELSALRDKAKHIIIPIYWGIDEETGKKIYDTDEMRDEFENAMGDFETDNYAECCDCGKELENDEHTQLDEDGRVVCDDCFGGK
jgi:formylmethanofuran dehydrogenase subunit E